jgi:RNA 2',3'-cyclic 3'-phosphodiesterase
MNKVPARLRLFVALIPPRVALDHLAEAIDSLRASCAELRWSDPIGWHLTLAFYGAVDELRRPELEQRLARAASRHQAIEARFRGGGAFARPARATLLYAGLEVDVPRIAGLAARCAAAGRRIGLYVDDRPYRPHLTLARSRGSRPTDMRSLVTALGPYRGPSWSASELVLMRSHLGPHPRYETLASCPLAAHHA